MKRIVRILFFLLLSQSSFCQISGIINIYTKVTLIDPPCNKITVLSSAGFSVGDTVLIIQMQGADIDQTSTSSFGNVTAINDAGNYEFAHIAAINGNDIYLKNTLLKSYTPAGSVQLIYVPQYTDVTIGGTLSAKGWDGNTGGVLAFVASGTVTFNSNIDVSGLGFRGGDVSANDNAYGCTNTTSSFSTSNAYYYAYPTPQGGKKGEGIANYITGQESGKGKNANGGGGGNGHNSGGAGGSNYGAGGRGGDKISTCSSGIYPSGPGIGGLTLSSYYNNSDNRIFMGGGGGGGQQNNLANGGPGPPNYWTGGTPGGPGGGIVIVKATTINGNGYSVLANGTLHPTVNRAWGDGGGGGGAGGTVVLSTSDLSTPITANVLGNKGDDVYDETSRDPGPGGGGGGGVIWLTAVNANITTSVAGGTFGVTYGPGTCACNRSAAVGSNGTVLTGLVIPESSTVFNQTCISLPVELLSFTGKLANEKVKLEWITSSEKNNSYFTIEKTTDLTSFTTVAKVKGSLTIHSGVSYFVYDEDPADGISYYRLSQTDLDGTTQILGIVCIRNISADKLIRKIYPVPFQNQLSIEWNGSAVTYKEAELKIYSVLGELLYDSIHNISEKTELTLPDWPAGIYTIVVHTEERTETAKIVKGN